MQRMEPIAGTTSGRSVQRFEIEAKQVIERVRTAFAAILDGLPKRAARAHEVSKAFGIHEKLGWQVANVVYEPDPFVAARHLPGPTSLKRFLDAARTRHIRGELIEAAEQALAEFQKLIERHAGDRGSLDLMLIGCAGDAAYTAHIAQRKAWFAAGSHIWGVQAKARVMTDFLFPSARSDWFDVAYFNGYMKLRRMRPAVRWEITRSKPETDDGSERSKCKREPLDIELAKSEQTGSPPLVKRFCSHPLPRIERMEAPNGFIKDILVEGPIGETGSLNCFTGEVLRDVALRFRTEHDWMWYASATMRTPCEVLILDQFIHEDLFGPIRPKLYVYSDMTDAPRSPITQRVHERLPVHETVQHLGKGLSGIRTPDAPSYTEMVRYAFNRLGWDPTQFFVYRVRMEYPPVPTTVTMESPLPDAPV